MAGTHIAVALSDSGRHGQVPVLAVHVVSSRPGLIAQPDTKVLHLQGALVVHLDGETEREHENQFLNHMLSEVYLLAADNLTSGLLELAQLAQEIPKARFGHNVVWSKDPHPVERRIGLLL